jgi:flagellar motility protein MotE (MotC chaperone)
MSGRLAGLWPRRATGASPVGLSGDRPALASLLLATALAALLVAAMKLPPLVQRAAAVLAALETEPTRPGRFEIASPSSPAEPAQEPVIEPAAGPGEALARPSRTAGPYSIEALEAVAAEQERHRAELEEREGGLVLREAALALVEERIQEQIGRLERLKTEFDARFGQASKEEEARIAHLIKVYESMKARSAATIFETMNLELLLPIVRGMRDTKVAAIVAEMAPEKARALTAELARRRELPAVR